jgi:hypothetical protein
LSDFDSNFQTPLMLAVRSGRIEDVQAMMQFCDLNFKQP